MMAQRGIDPFVAQDAFGTTHPPHEHRLGLVEALDLRPELATATAEEAIRRQAARITALGAGLVAPVHAVHRDATHLRVVSGYVDGLPLSRVLVAMEACALTLADDGVLDVAAAVVHSVAALHTAPGTLAHGAIAPAQTVLTRRGRVILGKACLGQALEGLQCNREEHWHRFQLALPPAANLPCFDQRADVTQLGVAVLALLLRRPLRPHEYPGAVATLADAATPAIGGRQSPLRQWLQQALQLHARPFASAAEARQPFDAAMAAVIGRSASPLTVQRMVRLMCGDAVERSAPAARTERRATAIPMREPSTAQPMAHVAHEIMDRPFARLRAMLPGRRAQ